MTPALYARSERAMQLLLPDGRQLKAGRAALTGLILINTFAGLARIGLVPPFSWVVELGYQILSRNRPFFARFLLTNYPTTLIDESPPPPD